MSYKNKQSHRVARPRAFERRAFLSLRVPENDKLRLKELARKSKRDTSNLALEFLSKGMDAYERALMGDPYPQNGVMTNAQAIA